MSNNPKFDEMLKKMQVIHEKKEKDYSGERDPHFNFRFSANFAGHFNSPVDRPYALLIGTKLARLVTLLERDIVSPQNESLEDTFIDIANYFLLWGSRRLKKDDAIEDSQISLRELLKKSKSDASIEEEMKRNQYAALQQDPRYIKYCHHEWIPAGSFYSVRCKKEKDHDGEHVSKEGYRSKTNDK